jgi:hypothetical protein
MFSGIVIAAIRHARPCAGHPRLERRMLEEDVDGRDEPGHDEFGFKGF